jgi:hypothetical protein
MKSQNLVLFDALAWLANCASDYVVKVRELLPSLTPVAINFEITEVRFLISFCHQDLDQ